MSEPQKPAEPDPDLTQPAVVLADLFADMIRCLTSPNGAALIFSRVPIAAPQQLERVVIRLSMEHLKLLAFVCRRQVLDYELGYQTDVPVPRAILNKLGIGLEDWEAVWGHRRSPDGGTR